MKSNIKVTSDNYITISGWMRTELGLKGNELMVYAIIYGFTQANNQVYYEGLQYLSDWIGANERTVRRALDSLMEKGLISKTISSGSASKLVARRSPAPDKISIPTPDILSAPTPDILSINPGHFVNQPRTFCQSTPDILSAIPYNISDYISDYSLSVCQSEIPDNYFIVESVESDRQTDRPQPQKKRKSYNDMLRAISSPLADTGITSEDNLAAYDENARRTAECVLPLEIKLHKGMFRQALRYLIAYSYRMPEDESIRNFTDTVIDDLVNMAHYGRYNGNSASYVVIIEKLNELNRNSSLADWMYAFYDEWKKILKERTINNPPAYLYSCCYSYLQEYKIKSIFADPF